MNKAKRFLSVIVLFSMYFFATLQTVFADDTEIFFAPPTSAAPTKANILFIIDSSGSMNWDLNGISGVPFANRRMTIVKDVMDDVLQNLSNVNVGLMRFNNGHPGSILHPVLDIDLPATPVVSNEVTVGNNDASEDGSGTVSLVSNTLDLNSSDVIGLRFENLNIPQGASILSASVVFTADGDSSGVGDVIIYGENVDSSSVLTSTLNDLKNRGINRVMPSTVWTMSPWLDGGQYASPDISSIVQSIANRPAWCGNNDITILMSKLSGSPRVAYSSEGVAASGAEGIFAPRIKIQYSQTAFLPGASKCIATETVAQIASNNHDFIVNPNNSTSGSTPRLWLYKRWSGNNYRKKVGMTFSNVNVPRNANISYAYLSVTAERNSQGTALTNIRGVKLPNIWAPTNYTGLIAAPKTSIVPWNIPNNWVTNGVYQVDVSAIVQEIVNQGGWSAQNKLALILSGQNGRHIIRARENLSNGTSLRIGYSGVYTPGLVTIRDDLRAAVQGLVASGGTPISGTYEEAGHYFRGEAVAHGLTRLGNRRNRLSHPLSYDSSGTVVRPNSNCTDANLDASECASEYITGSPKYISPITDSCQKSHIVFLTDGALNSHTTATETAYSNWSTSVAGLDTCSGGDECAVKMATFMHENDHSSLTSEQSVTTHMIGFGAGADPVLMQNMASNGGGGHYSPQDKQTLIDDLNTIVNSIANVNTTFVTSGVTINQYNQLTHNEERYFSLFTPDSKESWPGNVKRYKFSGGQIKDANNIRATDSLNAEFKDTAQSFWTSIVDGNDVSKGGTAEQLTNNRLVYSNLVSNDLAANSGNILTQSNSVVTAAMLGGVTPQRRDDLMYWTKGYDINDSSYDPTNVASLSSTPTRKDMGDPLHSQPTVLQYNDAVGALKTTRIYVGSNHGFLHSFDSSDGSESWAFVPKDLLPRLNSMATNSASATHSYGLDGAATIYLDDANGNGAVDPGDKAYLYIGQRRGGYSYYALDITNPDSPKLMFQISNALPATLVLPNLGQTWSTPSIKKMNLSGVNAKKLVMIFGGGYDDTQDSAGTSANTDTVGNNLYIVDALTGALLWDAQNDALAHGGSAGAISTMNSVPSKVSSFDMNEDKLIDHIYVTDTKAQVFRFDVDNTTGTIKGGRIAHLQDVNDVANNRRFYYSADIALIRQVGNTFVSVAMGSGYRAHPLNKQVSDYFYVLKDKGVLSGTYDMDASVLDLQNVTPLTDGDSNGVSDAVDILNDNTANKKGWYLKMRASIGEKIIERSITFNNALIFTSYIPPGSNTVCTAAAGGSRIYPVNILNGNPYIDTNGDGLLTEDDRYIDLVSAGIAPAPQVIIEDPSAPTLCVGTECGFGVLPPQTKGIMGIKWKKNN